MYIILMVKCFTGLLLQNNVKKYKAIYMFHAIASYSIKSKDKN